MMSAMTLEELVGKMRATVAKAERDNDTTGTMADLTALLVEYIGDDTVRAIVQDQAGRSE